MARRGIPTESMDDEALRSMMLMFADMFRDSAPMTAAEAATVILDGVRAGDWRILVGDDAHRLDEAVRADPLAVYGEGGLSLGSRHLTTRVSALRRATAVSGPGADEAQDGRRRRGRRQVRSVSAGGTRRLATRQRS